MAATDPSTADNAESTTDPSLRAEPTFELATLGYDGEKPVSDLSSRERKAYQEIIAIVPQFDSYGDVGKRDSAAYDVFSGSGSQYKATLSGEELCDCMDVIMNAPEACKHSLKLYELLDRGEIPAPREQVNEWMETTLYNRIVAVATRLSELKTARQTARLADEPAHAPDEYNDPIEAAVTVLEGFRDSYMEYRDRVNPDAPPLPAVVNSD